MLMIGLTMIFMKDFIQVLKNLTVIVPQQVLFVLENLLKVKDVIIKKKNFLPTFLLKLQGRLFRDLIMCGIKFINVMRC